MKKKIIAFSMAALLSLFCASAIFAKACIVSFQIEKESAESLFKSTKCATEISPTGSEVLKCLPGSGCEWTSGSAVNWGGKC